MLTLTDPWSPDSAPRPPLSSGAGLFVGVWTAFIDTAGALVSIVKRISALLPSGLPSRLGCVAMAAYLPSARAGEAAAELQLPPVPAAIAVALTVRPGSE